MTRKTAVVLYPGCVALDVVGPNEVFTLAAAMTARKAAEPAYDVVRAALEAGPVPTISGLTVMAEARLTDLENVHTIVVPGWLTELQTTIDPAVVEWVRAAGERVERVVGICTGAFVLAESGLLAGGRATTHWRAARQFADAFPDVDVEPDAIFVRHENVWTSAGVTAGIDLALALVEHDCGAALAQRIARELVVFLRRPGGQSQFSTYLRTPLADDDRVADVQQWIPEHLDDDLRVPALARRAAMSPRNFSRVFRQRVGTTPGRFVEKCRIEAVRNGLEISDSGLASLAARCGFASTEVMRRTFHRHFGVSPSAYRERFSRS